MAKNHYNRFRAFGPTPHLRPPKRAINWFFPDMTPILKVAPYKILQHIKKLGWSYAGISRYSKKRCFRPLSAFQSPYKPFFHTFRPSGPKARWKNANFIPVSWRPRRPQDKPKCGFFPNSHNILVYSLVVCCLIVCMIKINDRKNLQLCIAALHLSPAYVMNLFNVHFF